MSELVGYVVLDGGEGIRSQGKWDRFEGSPRSSLPS
jgi:hypothetical protein